MKFSKLKFKELFLSLILITLLLNGKSNAQTKISGVLSIPPFQWQKIAVFPDWKGHVDNTLAMNSMISFNFWHGQGKIYLSVSKQVKSFNILINGTRFDTSSLKSGGNYVLDFLRKVRFPQKAHVDFERVHFQIF